MACTVLGASRSVSLILRNSQLICAADNSLKILSTLPVTKLQQRFSSFNSSHPVRDINEYPEVEIVKNPPEWKYVERVLPLKVVPTVKPKTEYPSGWKPPQPVNQNAKYYVARSKNHMLSVYLDVSYRGQRKLTVVRRIQGDIWSLEKDLRAVVEKARDGKLCASRVNELSGQIQFHGDYYTVIKNFLEEKGF